jgi:hypothetical protein
MSFALVACGSDQPEGNGGGDEGSQSSENTPSPSPTPSGLTGDWKADPGQADRVQEKLTAAGFACSKNSDPTIDLRLCSISKKTVDAYKSIRLSQAVLRFASDPQGTVVLANLNTYGTASAPWRKTLAEALLPAADAAVYLADGEKLEWGDALDKGDAGDYLAVKGWTPATPIYPEWKAVPVTKEKALAPLQAAKLSCQFSEKDEWGTARPGLQCTDPSFKVKDEDGSMSGARAELVLIDKGEGVESIQLDGSHSRIPTENARGVKILVPRAVSVAKDDPDLQEAGAWIEKNLDALPHAAYVGRFLVTISVVPEGGIASWPYVRANIGLEQYALGLDVKGTKWENMSSPTPTWGSTPTPDDTPSS